MHSYVSPAIAGTTGLGVSVFGLPQQWETNHQSGERRQPNMQGLRAYRVDGVGRHTSNTRSTQLLNGDVLVYSVGWVQFGTALKRFVEQEPVKASVSVRALAARAFAARAERKGMPSTEWAERFTQNTHDE
ncbi:hypothetical protein BGLA2_190028 [Burkholderia gladioli]|uniref:hypothetical protein n=1 Tax=Burkholderia gladioli TaxID=28095 RepID=UPI001CAEB21F|nr:hypothetical protein [Burkholderia gladioli]CAG9208455.1 hypothetical protein BGLA2_190028 [Burkholderia gladioli]